LEHDPGRDGHRIHAPAPADAAGIADAAADPEVAREAELVKVSSRKYSAALKAFISEVLSAK
jgi:hypothetical protein